MDKVSNQSTPIWDRPSSSRGHLSSVDKAVQAHRDRVDARQMRTQNRLDASRDINERFFTSPENMAPLSANTEALAMVPDLLEEPAVSTLPIEGPQRNSIPMGMDDIYLEHSITPLRSRAGQMVEAETLEGSVEVQSDEVPKGTYVDYNA